MENVTDLTEEDRSAIAQNLELMLSESPKGGMEYEPESLGGNAGIYRGPEGNFSCEAKNFVYHPESGRIAFFGNSSQSLPVELRKLPRAVFEIAVDLPVYKEGKTYKGVVRIYAGKSADSRARKVFMETARKYNKRDELIEDSHIQFKELFPVHEGLEVV